MNLKTNAIILTCLTVAVLNLANASHATSAVFMEGQFEPVQDIGIITDIEAWEQPKTQYTPKNLNSEYQVRVNGTDKNGRGAYSYTMHFTDYDTKIIENGITDDGRYYVRQSDGKAYVTGERTDLSPVNQRIDAVEGDVNNIHKDITNVQNGLNATNNQINNIKNQVDANTAKINRVENRLESGLATVSALTALHPNPRSNEKLEVAIGAGMYADNVAGAIGLFYHPNDRVMLSIGAAYGGEDQFAGNFGITFGLGRRNNK